MVVVYCLMYITYQNGFPFQTLVNDIQDFFLLLLPLTCSMTLIHCIITGCLTKVVHPSSTGQVLGLNMAIHSSIRAISPTIGGYLISSYGLASLGGLGFISALITFILLPFTKLRNQLWFKKYLIIYSSIYIWMKKTSQWKIKKYLHSSCMLMNRNRFDEYE